VPRLGNGVTELPGKRELGDGTDPCSIGHGRRGGLNRGQGLVDGVDLAADRIGSRLLTLGKPDCGQRRCDPDSSGDEEGGSKSAVDWR
jgi:hypothetical protein